MKKLITRLISILLVLTICLSCLPMEALAWGKMSHVYTANLIEGEMSNDNGSMSLTYDGDSVFDYEIPDEFYDAIMSYPDAFRAGALGPDVYPDILTGQMYIHPEDDGVEAELEDFEVDPNPEKLKVDSGMWVEYLCNAVNKMGKDTEDRKMCLSFTLGCILHYCGDLYGHDFVNTFSGGAFPSFFSTEIFNIKGERLNNILSHLSVESYMDDIVYPTYDADRDGGIDGPNNFIAGAMVFDGTPAAGLNPLYGGYPATITEKLDEIKAEVSDIWIVGGLLENMVEDLFNEEGNNVPPHYTAFLNLRNFLTSTADEYREHMDPVSAGITLFCDRWAEDVDEGIVEFTATCDRIANRIVTGEKNPDIEKKTKEERLEEQNKIWTAFGYDMDEINMWLLITAYRPDADVEQMAKEFNDAGIYGDSFFDLILAELVLMGYITMDMVKTNDSAIMIIKEELSYWMDEYGNYMLFIPDFIIDGIEIPIIGDLLDVVTNLLKAPLYPIFEIIKGMIKDLFAEWVIGICTGTVSDYTGWDEKEVPENLVEIATKIFERIDNPEVQLDHEDNPYRPTEQNFEDLKEYMDILEGEAKYNIADSDFEALYNTITMFQLVLMGPENYSKFIKEYAGVNQTSYQMNTGSPEVTSLKVRIKTADLFLAGTNDNIYMVVEQVNADGSKTEIKSKLLDLAAHDDFEQGDMQTYTIELPETVKLSQLEIGLRKMPAFDFLPGVTDDWVCENIRVTPMYAGYELTAPIDLGGVSIAGIVQDCPLRMSFQDALKVREDFTNQKSQMVTNLKVEIKVKDEQDAGTDSDIYLKAVFGSTYWKAVLLDKGEGHDDLERGKTETYNIPITNAATGTAMGIPLDQLYVEFRHYGKDEANWAEVKVTPCYGSLELTTPITLGGQKFQERTWAPNFQTALKKATYREEPTLSQTATSLDVRIDVANEVGAGTDDDIYLNIYSNDSATAAQIVTLDKEGYNDFEQADSDVYSIVLSEAAAKIPLDQMRLVFERKRRLPKKDEEGDPALIHYEDEANWDEVLVTAYNGSQKLTDSISVGGTEFDDDRWDTDFATHLKLHYMPVAFEYKTNIDGGLLSYMDSLDCGEEWVDDQNELWTNTTLRKKIFLQIFKGFSPEIEYAGAESTPESQDVKIALDFTGVWNGVSNERRSQVKEFKHIYAVAGTVDIAFINDAGQTVHTVKGVQVIDNKASVDVPAKQKLVQGTYDLKVTYTPDATDPYYSATEVTLSDAVKITGPEYCQVTLKTDGTSGCTVTGGGKLQIGESVTIQATAARGYKFKEWKQGNKVISTTPNFFFTPTEDCTLTACFEAETYSVTLNGGASTIEAKVGDKIELTAEAKGLTGPSYQFYVMYPGETTWTKSGSNGKITTKTVTAAESNNGIRYKVEATDPFGRKATSNEVTIVVKNVVAPLSVTKQPADATIKVGATASLAVAASGGKAPYTYTWQVNVGGKWSTITNNTYYSGSGTATLSVTPNLAGSGEFRCVIKDSAGKEITSSTAKVTAKEVIEPMSVSKQPASATIDLGKSASLTVAVSGGKAPYTYTWVRKTSNRWVNVTEGSWCSGQGTTTLTVTPTTAGATEFCCVIKDSAGKEITSSTAKVTAKEVIAPMSVTKQPAGATIELGESASLTVAVSGGKAPYTYTWQRYNGSQWSTVTTGSQYSGQGTATLTVKPGAAGTAEFRCVIKDSAGKEITSSTAKVTAKEVIAPMSVTKQPAGATIELGESASLTVAVSGGKAPYTYTWQRYNGSQWSTVTTGSQYSGQGTATLTVKPGAAGTAEFRCVIKDSAGKEVTSATAKVTAKEVPLAIKTQPSSITASSGQIVTFTLEATGGKAPYTYKWQVQGGNYVNWTNADESWSVGYDSNAFTFVAEGDRLSTAYVYRCVITDAAGASVTSKSVAVSEKAGPLAIQEHPGSIATSAGQTVIFTVAPKGGLAPYTYKWQVQGGNFTSWTDVTGSWASGFDTYALSFVAEGDKLNGGYAYRCVITDANGATVTSNSATVIPKAEQLAIKTQPENIRAEIGQKVSFSVAVTGGTAPYTYRWQVAQGNDGWRDADSSWSTGYNSDCITFTVGDDEFFVGYEYHCVITDAEGATVASKIVVVLPK